MEDTTVRDQPAPPPPPSPEPPRRLLRRTEEEKVAGVCAGIADYLGVDVTIVRIATVLLTFAGPGLPAYIVAWVLMPEAPKGTPPNPVRRGSVFGDGNGAVAGVALLAFAALIVFDGGLFDRSVTLPVLLIGAGVWLLVRDRDAASAPPAGPGLSAAAGPVPDPTSPSPGTGVEPVGGAVAPWASSGSSSPYTSSYGAAEPPPAPSAAPAGPVEPAPSSRLGAVVLGVLALGAAGVWLLAAAGTIDPDIGDVIAAGLVVLGLGLVVGARWGRARSLIVPGVLGVVALTAVTAVDVPLRGGAGERLYRPTTVAEVEDEYRLGAGEMELDLRGLDLEGGTLAVTASIGAGQLTVLVPEDATVELSGEVTVGQIVLPGQDREEVTGGLGLEEDTVLQGAAGGGTLVLDLQVGLGEVEVGRG